MRNRNPGAVVMKIFLENPIFKSCSGAFPKLKTVMLLIETK